MALLVDDRDLLARFREGRPEALDRVYRHYAPRVAAFLRAGFMYLSNGQPTSFRGLVSPFELENAVQEVFTRALTERARLAYDGLRPYMGFLCGIARNVVLDDLRRAARRGEVIEPGDVVEQRQAAAAGGGPVGAGGAHPAETIDERRGRDLVATFVQEECDERDRTLFELRFRQELTQVDAARQAGLTRIQVRKWETKFRGRLLRYLKRSNYVREA
jgi:RNA polymerase sigma factor (sigma-70 family)